MMMRNIVATDIVRDVFERLLVKPKRASQALDCSLRYLYYLEERGEVEFVRDGRAVFVVVDSLIAYVARLREKAAARTKARSQA